MNQAKHECENSDPVQSFHFYKEGIQQQRPKCQDWIQVSSFPARFQPPARKFVPKMHTA